MRPKQVISICGDSAVGKQTLIEAIDARRKEILDRFAITESLSLHSRSRETRIAKTPFQGLEKMYQSHYAETIIFRWQFKDDGEIEKLLAFFPYARHRVILIWRPWDIHVRDFVRIHRKLADTEAMAEKLLQTSWKRRLQPRFGPESELRTRRVEVELVDGNIPTYPPITNWNLLQRGRNIESPSPPNS